MRHTVNCALIRPGVAEPLTRAIAPVAVLDSTCAREIPGSRSRPSVHVYAHHAAEVVGDWGGRMRFRRQRCAAEAGDGERRVVGGPLAFEAHGCRGECLGEEFTRRVQGGGYGEMGWDGLGWDGAVLEGMVERN